MMEKYGVANSYEMPTKEQLKEIESLSLGGVYEMPKTADEANEMIESLVRKCKK